MSDRPTRKVKWLGDPPAVYEHDWWSIPDWKYENKRVIAMPGRSDILVNQSAIPGLSRSYKWERDLPHFILEMDAADALLLCAAMPKQFRDVTDNPYPEHVQHRPIVVRRLPNGKHEIVKDPPLIELQPRRQIDYR